MNKIKELREEAKMTQQDVAEALQTARSLVSKYERGEIDLNTDTIIKACQLFTCSADYLLGLSTQRTLQISDADAEILAAYKRAPDSVRAGIDALLEPYKAKKEAAGG